MNPGQRIVLSALRLYQVAVSPVWTALSRPWGLGCRFTPTCSQYAVEAVRRFGALRGLGLAVRRLSRCHPWGPWGYDPVPDRIEPLRRKAQGSSGGPQPRSSKAAGRRPVSGT